MRKKIYFLFLVLFILSCEEKPQFNIEGDWTYDNQYNIEQENNKLKKDDVYIDVSWGLNYFKIYDNTIEYISSGNDEDFSFFKRDLKTFKLYKLKGNEVWILDATSKIYQKKYYLDSITDYFIYYRDLENNKKRLKSPYKNIDFDEIVFSSIGYTTGFVDYYTINKNGIVNKFITNKILENHQGKLTKEEVDFLFQKYQDTQLYYQPNTTTPQISIKDGGGIELLFTKNNIINKSILNENDSGNPKIEEAIYYTRKAIEKAEFKLTNNSYPIPFFNVESYTYLKSDIERNLTDIESNYLYFLLNKAKETNKFDRKYKLNLNEYRTEEIKSMFADDSCIEINYKNGKTTYYDLGVKFFAYSHFNSR
ncbi:hypothetical protein [Empedobacter sedimenti]|uniref:hypothetical protein n=1 Tax=Empedobacter sedimenti TaxID=3042610 RepID=UPI0024A64B9B|nr:hypothetical protein [Empedobacter sedimenti]